jgi:hypothetical protein
VEQLMSSKQMFTSKELDYYVSKFQRRMFRRLVEYRVLRNNLEEQLPHTRTATVALLNIDAKVVANIEVKDHVEKACLIGLKAEFELFFTIYCSFVVDHQLRLVEGGHDVSPKMLELLRKTKDKFFGPFISSGFKDARQIFVEQLIPKHGLGNLADLMEDCGWDIVQHLQCGKPDVLDEQFRDLIDNPWAQINMAFQVRHAIEHTFSRVGSDGRFLYHTLKKDGGCLRKSTWRRWWSSDSEQSDMAPALGLGPTPKVGDRVPIDETDVLGTAAAMTWVSQQVLHHWKAQ